MKSSELSLKNIISFPQITLPFQAKSGMIAFALLCASMTSAEGSQPAWQSDKIAQSAPSKSFGDSKLSDEQFLEEELANWVLLGGEVENRGKRYIASERIRETFYGEVRDPGEVTDMRFRSADLDLSQLKLTSLPNVFHLTPFVEQLLFVNLERNQLTELPETFWGLVNLQALCLNENCFAELPEEISGLENLRSLAILANDLTTLPASFAELVQLEELALGLNQIGWLREELGNLVRLEYLDLHGNQLTEVPQWIQGLPKLRYLDLSGNPL